MNTLPPTLRPSRARSRRGFTLIEVLLATAAFAIVLAAINSVFFAAIRLRQRAVASLDRATPLRHAFTQMERDLAQVVRPGGILFGPLQSPAVTNVVPGQASPTFYTATGTVDDGSPWAEVQRVAYALVPSAQASRGMTLVRAVNRNLLSPNALETPEIGWMLDGVERVTFSFFDGSQWRGTWDSAVADAQTGSTNTLPLAVKVELQMAAAANASQRPEPLTWVVPLAMATAPMNSSVSTNTGGAL